MNLLLASQNLSENRQVVRDALTTNRFRIGSKSRSTAIKFTVLVFLAWVGSSQMRLDRVHGQDAKASLPHPPEVKKPQLEAEEWKSRFLFLPAGIRIVRPRPAGEPSAASWNRLVLHSQPRFESGDLELVPDSIKKSVQRVQLVIMASTTNKASQSPQDREIILKEVGVGYCVPFEDGTYLSISSNRSSDQRANLSFVERQVLSQGEKQLKTIRPVINTSQVCLFDVPCILYRKDRHQDLWMRHVIVCHPQSGVVFMYLWCMDKGPDGAFRYLQDSLRIVHEGEVEDRRIHVDGKEFFLGVPSERAFALSHSPPGIPLAPIAGFPSVGLQSSLRPDELLNLLTTLSQSKQVEAPVIK